MSTFNPPLSDYFSFFNSWRVETWILEKVSNMRHVRNSNFPIRACSVASEKDYFKTVGTKAVNKEAPTKSGC